MGSLFSVVITCYNQEGFMREAVDSAWSQNHHPSMEIIAVGDGSQDGTAEILRSYGDAIVFAGLLSNSGVGAARNHGASLAT